MQKELHRISYYKNTSWKRLIIVFILGMTLFTSITNFFESTVFTNITKATIIHELIIDGILFALILVAIKWKHEEEEITSIVITDESIVSITKKEKITLLFNRISNLKLVSGMNQTTSTVEDELEGQEVDQSSSPDETQDQEVDVSTLLSNSIYGSLLITTVDGVQMTIPLNGPSKDNLNIILKELLSRTQAIKDTCPDFKRLAKIISEESLAEDTLLNNENVVDTIENITGKIKIERTQKLSKIQLKQQQRSEEEFKKSVKKVSYYFNIGFLFVFIYLVYYFLNQNPALKQQILDFLF